MVLLPSLLLTLTRGVGRCEGLAVILSQIATLGPAPRHDEWIATACEERHEERRLRQLLHIDLVRRGLELLGLSEALHQQALWTTTGTQLIVD